MTLVAAWTLVVVVVTIVLLATERVAAPLVVMGAVTVLLVTRVVDVKAAMSGFSNEAPLTIGALYIVTGAAERTGALDALSRRFVGTRARAAGQVRATPGELGRLLLPASGMSLFVYNTPTIALLAPQTAGWARRSGRSPSWYLLALNFAVLLAGLVTAIGTTTNVVVSGLLSSTGRTPLGLFELAPVGLPLLAVGLVVLVGLGGRLTPSRQAPSETAAGETGPGATGSGAPGSGGTRDYSVEMEVPAGSALHGRTVEEAGLRNLDGVFLVHLSREERVVAPVGPDDVLRYGDRLTFAGNVTRVVDLQRMPGLISAESPHLPLANGRHPGGGPRFFEAVIGTNTMLVGRTLKEASFRGRYDAAVVAIHRAGERVGGKLGQVRLRTGDLLLVLADEGFARRWGSSGDFGLVAPLDGATAPPRSGKAWTVAAALLFFLAAASTGLLGVLEAALIAAIAVVATGAISPAEARRSVNLDVLVVLAGSFGIGAAIAASGLAREVANVFVSAAPAGRGWQVAAELVATWVLTQVVTNNAAAIIMFPIAIATAGQLHTDPRAFVIAVVVGASLAFLTPIGYQTNMIVQGLGGYRFRDFLPLGAVLSVVSLVTAGVVIPIGWT